VEGEEVAAPYFQGTSRDRALSSGQSGAWGSVPHGDHLGLHNVTMGWAYQGATPVVADGRAYYALAGTIRARDLATGRTVWRRDYAGGADAQAISPPAVVNGVLFFGTVDGHVYGTDVDTGMTLFAWDVGEPVMFQPIVAQGWLYVTTGKGHVVGLELGDAALDGWHMWGGNPGHNGLTL
jgi:Ca-activated chloride channel family protein